MKRLGLADAGEGRRLSQTRGLHLLAEMDHVVPRLRQLVLIEPYYSTPGSTRRPMRGEHLFRIIRRQFRVVTLRYRRRVKNAAQLVSVCTLLSLYFVGGGMLEAARYVSPP